MGKTKTSGIERDAPPVTSVVPSYADLDASRLAALNLMEDAVLAKERSNRLVAELQETMAARAEAEKALRTSEEKFRMLYNSMDEGYCIIEFFDGPHGPLSDYIHIEANPAYTTNAGIPDIVGQKVREMVPDEADGWVEIYRNVLVTGEPIRFERELVATGRYLELSAFRIEPVQRQQVAVLFRDITARRRGEEANAKLAAIVDSSDDAIISKDLNGTITSWNTGAEKIFGFTALEAIGQPGRLLMLEDRLDEEPYLLERVNRGKIVDHYETVRRRKDGSEINISLTVSPLRDVGGNIIGSSKIARNITERKQVEAAIAASEERYRILFDSMDQGYCIIEVLFDAGKQPTDYRFIQVNNSFERQAGMQDVVGKRMLEFVSAIEPHWLNNYASVALTGEPIRFSGEYKALNRYFDVFAFRTDDWPEHHIAVLFADVTASTTSKDTLRKSEERLRLLIDSATEVAIFTTDRDGIVDSWNEGARRIYGHGDDEIIGESAAVLFTPDDRKRDALKREMRMAKEKGRANDERWHLRKDGSQFRASGLIQPLGDDHGQGYVIIARDMTAQLRADESKREKDMLKVLVDSQEMERKRIARDLHDELGQQLTALRWKLERVHMEAPEALAGAVAEIRQIAKQIDEGVDFLAWELRPAALDDLGLLAAIEKYVAEWSGYSGVAGEVEASALGDEKLDPALETTFYRIVQEGLNNVHKHASAKNAQVTIATRGSDLVLTINDDGVGFDAENPSGRSTGIGLLGMEERLKIVGGQLQVESGEQGTTIFISAPLGTPIGAPEKNAGSP